MSHSKEAIMKTSRLFVRIFLVFAMFLLLMAPVFAATDYGFHWEISEDGVLTISGGGKMEVNVPPWEKQADQIRKVVIGEGFTELEGAIFQKCENLEEILFPQSLRVIPSFIADSPALKRVYIPAGVVKLHPKAFYNCDNLERIDVDPENPVFASDNMGVVYSKDMTMLLMAPEGLRGSYIIPSNVYSVGGKYQYEYYSENDDIHFEVNEVYSPFASCNELEYLQISEGVKVIGDNAFSGCTGLTEVIIPDSVFRIDQYAFRSCISVKSLHIGSGVKVIGDYAFHNMDALTELTVPGNVRDIGMYAFAEMDNLEKVVLEDGVDRIDRCTFLSCFKLKELRLSATLHTVSESAFRNCYELVNLKIPANVFSIESLAFDNINGLKKVTFEGNAPILAEDSFEGGTIEFSYPKGNETWDALVGTNAGTYARIRWSSYQPETIPDDVVYLLDTAFSEKVYEGTYYEFELWSDGILYINGKGLSGSYDGFHKDRVKKIVIEEGIHGFDLLARFDCENLEEIILPDSMNNLRFGLFSSCSRLKKITFLGDAPSFDELALPSKDIEFCYPEGDESWDLLVGSNVNQGSRIIWTAYEREEPDVPGEPEEPELSTHGTLMGGKENIKWVLYEDGLMEISGTGRFDHSNWGSVSELIKKVVIREGITHVGFSAFVDCVNMTEIVLPNTLRGIDDMAFRNCPKLQRVNIPAGVINLEPTAFLDCESLAFIEVDPENPYFTGDARGVIFNKEMTMLLIAPRGLTGSYTVPESVTEVGGTVTFRSKPNRETTYGYIGFNGCGKLTEVILPKGLVSITSGAFENCVALQRIQLPEGLRQIGSGAFRNCDRIKEMCIPGVEILYEGVFAGCNALERVVIGEGTREIQDGAFQECRTLREVILPDSLVSIGYKAFHYTNLRSVTIPANVTSILSEAFSYTDMTHLVFLGEPPKMTLQGRYNFNYVYPEGSEAWLRVAEENKDPFYQNFWLPYRTKYVDGQPCYVIAEGTDNGISWVLEGDGTLTLSGKGTIGTAGPWAEMELQILCLVVEEGITAIAEEVFAEFERLRCVHLPESLESVGAAAFVNCDSLEKLEFAGPVPSFGANCFANVAGVLCYDVADGSWNDEILKPTGGSFILIGSVFPEKPEQPEQPQGMLGDVDGNGKLNYSDALMILRASIGLETLTPEQEVQADFDGDGIINYNDALQVLRASIGL